MDASEGGSIARFSPRFLATACSLAVACVVLPRSEVGSALASAAGALFEAAPLILAAALLPARWRGVAGLAGCGCGRGALPGALAPAAIGLCWIAFGPAVALARALAALAMAMAVRTISGVGTVGGVTAVGAATAVGAIEAGGAVGALDACAAIPLRGHGNGRRGLRWPSAADSAHNGGATDPFADLLGIAGSCAAASLLAGHLGAIARGPVLEVAAGALLGLLAPCATAGVAMAAGFASHAPALAAAMLAANGIVPRRQRRWTRAPTEPRTRSADARFAATLVACALAVLSARGPSGLLNPRLLPVVAAGAAAAAVYALRRRAGHPAAVVVPAVMLGALVLGSPQPTYNADETNLATGFPGEHITFTGIVAAPKKHAATTLVRFTITCCRIDAHPVSVLLDRRLPVPTGTWIQASGTYRTTQITLTHWHQIPPPKDPFAYQ